MNLLELYYFICIIVGLSEEPCSSHLPASEDIGGAAEVSPSSSTGSVSGDSDSLRQPEAEAEAGTSAETKDKAKSKRNRCFMCRKKVGLTGKYHMSVMKTCETKVVCDKNKNSNLIVKFE